MYSLKDRGIRLLRWSEKYTKTDMVYLFSGGSWLALAQFAASLAGFGVTIVLANTLTPETLGSYRFLLAGLALFGIFALPGMRAALRESTPKGNLANLSLAFRAMMRYSIIGSLGALAVAAYYFVQGDSGFGIGFCIIALALPFFDSSTAYLEYLNALKFFKKATVYTVITRVVLLGTTLAAALLYPDQAYVIFAAFLIGQILPGLWLHKKTEREYVDKNDISDPTLITYSKHLTAMAALGLIAGQLDRLFVWEFIGAEGLAILYIAYVLPQEAARFLRLVATLAFPKFAVTEPVVIKKTLPLKVLRFFVLICIGVFMYYILSPYLFALLFSDYMAGVAYTQVLMLSVLSTAFSPMKTFLTTQKETRYLYILSIIPPGLRIASAVILIIPFGLWGAVFAILAESIARSILIIFFFVRSGTKPI